MFLSMSVPLSVCLSVSLSLSLSLSRFVCCCLMAVKTDEALSVLKPYICVPRFPSRASSSSEAQREYVKTRRQSRYILPIYVECRCYTSKPLTDRHGWNKDTFQWFTFLGKRFLVPLTSNTFIIIIIIMYIYRALINDLSAHIIHINLNIIFYTHVEHSPIKNNLHKSIIWKQTHRHTHAWAYWLYKT